MKHKAERRPCAPRPLVSGVAHAFTEIAIPLTRAACSPGARGEDQARGEEREFLNLKRGGGYESQYGRSRPTSFFCPDDLRGGIFHGTGTSTDRSAGRKIPRQCHGQQRAGEFRHLLEPG